MNKNIIRSIFWGSIALILLILGVMGCIYNNRILNTYNNSLEAITEIFNNSKTIRNYETVNTIIKAEVKGKKIIVTADGVLKNEYVYKLKRGYLETTLENNDSLSKIILMVLADSIAVNKGQEREAIYPLFNNDTLLSYKLKDGIEYKKDNENYIVKLSLDYYIFNEAEENIEDNTEENTPEIDNDIDNNLENDENNTENNETEAPTEENEDNLENVVESQ